MGRVGEENSPPCCLSTRLSEMMRFAAVVTNLDFACQLSLFFMNMRLTPHASEKHERATADGFILLAAQG